MPERYSPYREPVQILSVTPVDDLAKSAMVESDRFGRGQAIRTLYKCLATGQSLEDPVLIQKCKESEQDAVMRSGITLMDAHLVAFSNPADPEIAAMVMTSVDEQLFFIAEMN